MLTTWSRALALTSVVLLAACGTVMHGTRQNIDVQSSPSGVKVETSPATGTFTTPTTLDLERKHNYVLTFSAPGYAPATYNIHNGVGTGTVIADVLLTGLVGVVVDGLTGGWYGLSPEAATVTLNRLNADAGPEQIRLRVARSDGGRNITISSDDAAAGVSVKVDTH